MKKQLAIAAILFLSFLTSAQESTIINKIDSNKKAHNCDEQFEKLIPLR